MRIILVVAMTRQRLIGRGGRLPWHVPDDLRHFKRVTMGKAVVMGRKTFQSVGRPLPGRRNIVISSNPAAVQVASGSAPPPDTTLDVVDSFDAALRLCRARGEAEVMIVGGARVYAEALPVADEMIVTWIDQPGLSGDAFFPEWDAAKWRAEPYDGPPGLQVERYTRAG